MQVKRDEHTFSSKNCMETKVHFTYIDNYIIQRQIKIQSGFNAEQIDKDKYPESKNHLKIKSKITS
jgi:hypothetical protein